MKMVPQLVAAVFVLALTTTTGALAAPPTTAIGTLTIPDLGSSPVAAWSWGVSNSGSVSSGGSGAGKANFQDLSLTRFTDGQSPSFVEAVSLGMPLPSAKLVVGATTIELKEVMVTSYSSGAGGEKTQTENITFNFGSMTYKVNGVSKCVGSSC